MPQIKRAPTLPLADVSNKTDIYVCAVRQDVDLLEGLKKRFGARIAVFTEVSACVSEALEYRPKLLIFDLTSPEPGLFRQFSRLKTQASAQEVRVLVRTQHYTDAVIGSLLRRGVDSFLLSLSSASHVVGRAHDLIAGVDDVRGVGSANKPLVDRVSKFVSGGEALVTPPEMRERFETVYGVRLDLFSRDDPATASLFGVLPIDHERFAVYGFSADGPSLWAAPQVLRAHGFVHSGGFDRGDPSETVRMLQNQMGPFLSQKQSLSLVYGVASKKLRRLFVIGAGDLSLWYRPEAGAAWSGMPTHVVPLRSGSALDYSPISLSLRSGGGLFMSDAPADLSRRLNQASDAEEIEALGEAMIKNGSRCVLSLQRPEKVLAI